MRKLLNKLIALIRKLFKRKTPNVEVKNNTKQPIEVKVDSGDLEKIKRMEEQANMDIANPVNIPSSLIKQKPNPYAIMMGD